MKRTQMYFEAADWERIQAHAEASGRSAAAVVRDAVTEYFARETDGDEDPVRALIREARADRPRGRPTDSARNHDHYLYGWPKEDESWPEQND